MYIDINNMPQKVSYVKTLNYKKIQIKSSNFDLSKNDLYDSVLKLSYKMITTCIKENGCGLSAIQIGIPKNIFIIMDNVNDNLYKVFLNPNYKPFDDKKVESREGCLSVPGKMVKISRYECIEADYWTFDVNNKPINKKELLDDYYSKVFQHEYDHTKGITIMSKYKK